MQVEGVRKILALGFLWGAFCFIAGYALNGHIWDILKWMFGFG
jgi:hypothetical protein